MGMCQVHVAHVDWNLDCIWIMTIPRHNPISIRNARNSCSHCMQHYPARLHQLYLVDLPVVLKWVVAAVKPVLHAETRAKIQVCQLPSPVFPFPSSILDFTSPLKRISLPSAAHTSGGQVSPLMPALDMHVALCHCASEREEMVFLKRHTSKDRQCMQARCSLCK